MMNLYESIKSNLKESVKVGPIYRIGPEEYITSYNDIRLDGVNTTLEDIELFKRVDWSDTAPDKVNYLLAANMRWDVDPSVSVPVLYNIGEDEYEDEINPALLGVFDEDLDLKIYNAVDEAIKNLALEISMSGRMNESEKPNEGYIVFQSGGMLGDSHDLEDKIFPTKEEAQEALKLWKNSYGRNKSYYKPEGSIYKYKGKTAKEIKDEMNESEKLNESENEEEPIEAIGFRIYITNEVAPGTYQSELYQEEYTNDIDRADDIVAELRAQGLNASYEYIWNREEDPDYDKYADETDWAAEEEADAIERMERRYGQGQE